MTTPPAPQEPSSTSGQAREDTAAAAGAQVGLIFAGLSAALTAALSVAVYKAVTGGAQARGLMLRKLRQQAQALITHAHKQAQQAVTQAQSSVEKDVQRVTRADLGHLPPGQLTKALEAVTPPQVVKPSRAELLPGGIKVPTPRLAIEAPKPRAMRDLSDVLQQAGLNAYRDIDDTYQDVIAQAMAYRAGIGEAVKDLSGPQRAKQSLSRLQVAQKALDDFARRGITGFTDSAGRRWELASYTEMATRTASSRLHLQQQLAAMGPAGVDLVVVDGPSAEMSCPKCAPFEGKVLSVGGVQPPGVTVAVTDATGHRVNGQTAGSLADAIAAGLLHPNCFPGDVLVSAPSGVRAADSRWYEGELVVIHTASGDELPVTPNHPVLTPEGWIAAGALKVGQRVIRYGGRAQQMIGMSPGDEQVPARIGKVFDSLRQASTVLAVRVPASTEQFHGDGGSPDAQVVLADRLLQHNWDAQRSGDSTLVIGGAGLGALLAERPLDEFGMRAASSTNSVMRSAGQSQALCRRHAREAAAHGLATADLASSGIEVLADAGLLHSETGGNLGLGLTSLVPLDDFADLGLDQAAVRPDAGGLDLAVRGALTDAEDGRHLAEALAGSVCLDEITDLGRRQVATHVYNLQTGDGWYVASGIVVHNCRHSLLPFTDGAGMLPVAGGQRGFVHQGQPYQRGVIPDQESPSYKAQQKQRALERRLRRADALSQAAITPQARSKARVAHAAAQKALTEHIKANHLTRQRGREHAGTAR